MAFFRSMSTCRARAGETRIAPLPALHRDMFHLLEAQLVPPTPLSTPLRSRRWLCISPGNLLMHVVQMSTRLVGRAVSRILMRLVAVILVRVAVLVQPPAPYQLLRCPTLCGVYCEQAAQDLSCSCPISTAAIPILIHAAVLV